ncbi:helix-turn-helix domain-containing protein [Granulicella cerasi]|uniref:Helix-turn-helix domain-containing protein n=1 Tax=Granulicella cerasi TaxID=741063 RepID=A0ABW1Z5L1_9BACT|nr:helix-turn-helix domain-containing protein [Granulicella cerasi]
MRKQLTTLDILRDARDSGLLRKAAQSLYYHLALRADQRTDYSTYVGYETLCADTGLDSKTLQKAARELESDGLVSRTIRPNRSNVWHLNIWEMHDRAEAQRVPTVNPFVRQGVVSDSTDEEPDHTTAPADLDALDCTDGLTDAIVSDEHFAGKINADDARRIAEGICAKHQGLAPLVAWAEINEEAKRLAAAASNPAGYLRRILVGTIEDSKPGTVDESAIAKFDRAAVRDHLRLNGGVAVDPVWGTAMCDATMLAFLAHTEPAEQLSTPHLRLGEDGDAVIAIERLSPEDGSMAMREHYHHPPHSAVAISEGISPPIGVGDGGVDYYADLLGE